MICMLSSGPVCDETLIGGGVLGAMRPGSLLIVMSSIPVATAQHQAELAAEKGIDYLMRPFPAARRGHVKGLWPSWPAVPRMHSSGPVLC